MATRPRKTCNFVILRDKDVSQAICYLRSIGHTVITSMPSSYESLPESLRVLRDASDYTIDWPDWETEAGEMEIKAAPVRHVWKLYKSHH
ncbi:hypothetical protein Tco_0686798 [Tanacetum coccineum]